MSWLWGNETTEQAQIVVSALQGELDERELKIQALEAALRREQQDFQQLLQSEIRELETKRSRIAQELDEVEALIASKQQLLQKGKSSASGSSSSSSTNAAAPKKKKAPSANGTAASAAAATVATATTAAAAAAAPLEKKASEKTKKKKKKQTTAAAASGAPAGESTRAVKKALPLDEHVLKVAKVEPNVAFIIQRSTNSNTVVYAGQLQGKALDAQKPLEVFWIMYEKSGAPREDLNMIERNTAYGASCTPHPSAPGQYHVVLSSLKDRECVLLVDSEHGRVQARTTINGKPNVVLSRVFVQMTTGWVPSVDYIELFGFDPVTLEPVYEKKSNK